MDDLEQNMV